MANKLQEESKLLESKLLSEIGNRLQEESKTRAKSQESKQSAKV